MRGILFIIFSLLLAIILLIPSISSLGVSPPIVRIDFEPNLSTSFDMGVYNIPAKDQNVEIYISFFELNTTVVSEFEDIISLEKTRLSFTKDENMKSLKVYINFSDGMSKAGVHELRIGARPFSEEQEGVQIIAGNEVKLFINVSNKYEIEKIKKLEILNVVAKDVKQGGESEIKTNVKSKSNVRLEGVFAEVNISQENTVIESLKTEPIDLEPEKEGTLKTTLNTRGIEPGILNILASVFYNSRTATATTTMRVLEGKGISFWIYIIITLFIIIIIAIIILFLVKMKKQLSQQTAQQSQQQIQQLPMQPPQQP